MWITKLVFEFLALKAKITGVLTGCTVSMVACYIRMMLTTRWPMIVHLCETIIVGSYDTEW